jgi:hypothetical protein
MTDIKTVFSSFYRPQHPWGQVRRRNALARLKHVFVMTAVGILSLAALALVAVFAGILALIAAAGVGIMALVAALTRKPVRVSVRSQQANTSSKPDGVLEARKNGSTWEVY